MKRLAPAGKSGRCQAHPRKNFLTVLGPKEEGNCSGVKAPTRALLTQPLFKSCVGSHLHVGSDTPEAMMTQARCPALAGRDQSKVRCLQYSGSRRGGTDRSSSPQPHS